MSTSPGIPLNATLQELLSRAHDVMRLQDELDSFAGNAVEHEHLFMQLGDLMLDLAAASETFSSLMMLSRVLGSTDVEELARVRNATLHQAVDVAEAIDERVAEVDASTAALEALYSQEA